MTKNTGRSASVSANYAKIYVASSWRNQRQPDVIRALRNEGHDVYDFKNPEPGNKGFHWSEIDPEWKRWSPEQFRRALAHPIAVAARALDVGALNWADVCVLLMPCGRSAHLELGYCLGAGKCGCILLSDGEPEQMYGMAHLVTPSLEEVLDACAKLAKWRRADS